MLERDQRARLTTWYCPDDGRLVHVLVTGAGIGVNDKILGGVECHTWSPERRSQTLLVAAFDPPEGFSRVESDQDGTLRWERGAEVLVLTFGMPASPQNALTATRRSLPPGLLDLQETLLVGPDQRPRARITGLLPTDHTVWRYTYDLLECGDRVYLATHSIPVKDEAPVVIDGADAGSTERPEAIERGKHALLERVRCPVR